MIDLALFVLAAAGITFGVMKHLQVKSLTALVTAVKSDPSAFLDALKQEVNDLETAVRAKLDASSKWLRAEFARMLAELAPPAPPESPAPSEPAAPAAVAEAPPHASAAVAPADGGGTETPEQLVAKIDEAVAALTAKRARIAEAQQAKAAAEATLKEALAS